MGPPISQNGSAKLSISSKNSKRKMLSGQDPEPVREQDGQLLGRLSPVLLSFTIVCTNKSVFQFSALVGAPVS